MLLEEIQARDFRNLTGEIACGPDLNILIGDNGQGKTNWLEAISILATTRSFKTAKLHEAIRFGEELAIVRGSVRQSEDIRRDMQAALEGNTKSFLINGKKESVSQYLGQLHAVVFNSDELEIVRGQPDARRRFLDGTIVAIHPPFVKTIADYNRVIKQKNSLLQNARDNEFSVEKAAGQLAPWNEQLVTLAAKIHRSRVRIVQRLNEALECKLFGTEEITITYISSLESKGDLADYEHLIAERLAMRVQAETVAGHSLIGTHRDDLEILLDGRDIRRFGSAGQQRSALLMLQLATIAIYHAQRGEYPLFLLDDIDAELDYHRIGQLLEYLRGKTQTFVTTSKESFVEQFGADANILKVVSGKATTEQPGLLQQARETE
ncbi:MAG: DNA replication/repair protein RecF [Pyrinomonadaceae bacterium]